MILVNFKTYRSGLGERGMELVWEMEMVVAETGVEVIPVVQLVDLRRLAGVSNLQVWAQHADAITEGAHTGGVLPEAVEDAGSKGVILNHSERKFGSTEELKKARDIAGGFGLKVLICAEDVNEVKKVLNLKPDYVAYEPPELIGSADVSVVTRPEVVREVVKLAGKAPVIIGAGVHSVEDIRKGLELGAKGFLIASAIMKAKEPVEKLRELAGGYR